MRKRKSLLLIISMVLLVCACGKSEVPSQKEDAEEVVQENATTATEDEIEENSIESTQEVVQVSVTESTPEPTAGPTPEPIVYEGIDMESTLPGVEWSKTFNGIINEPKLFLFNDSTNKKIILEQGQEVEFEETDSVGIYIPEGEAKLGQIDKNGVFSNYMPGSPTIMTELWVEYENKETAVVESHVTFNGEEITLTATLILK